MMNKLFFDPKSGEVMLLNPSMTISKYMELFGSPEIKHMYILLNEADGDNEKKRNGTISGIGRRLNSSLGIDSVTFGYIKEYTKQDLDLHLLDATKFIMADRMKRIDHKE